MPLVKPATIIIAFLVALSAFIVGRVSILGRLLPAPTASVTAVQEMTRANQLSSAPWLEEPIDLGLYAMTLLPLRPQSIRIQPPPAADSVARLRFWVHGGMDGGQLVRVFIEDNQGEDVRWIVAADGWTFFEIPVASLAPPEQIETIIFEILGDGAQAPVYIDDIEWVLR